MNESSRYGKSKHRANVHYLEYRSELEICMNWQLRDAKALGMGWSMQEGRLCQDWPWKSFGFRKREVGEMIGQHPNQDMDKHIQVVSDPFNQICSQPYKTNFSRHLVAPSSQF